MDNVIKAVQPSKQCSPMVTRSIPPAGISTQRRLLHLKKALGAIMVRPDGKEMADKALHLPNARSLRES